MASKLIGTEAAPDVADVDTEAASTDPLTRALTMSARLAAHVSKHFQDHGRNADAEEYAARAARLDALAAAISNASNGRSIPIDRDHILTTSCPDEG